MKIAQVVSTFPPRLGGMGAVAFDEAQGLAARGHAVTVFTLASDQSVVSKNPPAFPIVHLRPLISGGDAGFVPQLAGRLKSFDVIHLHYPWYGGAEWVLRAHKMYDRPYVLTYHMDAAPTVWYKRVVQAIYDPLFARAIVKGANRVLAVNRAYALTGHLKNMIPPERLIELPNGVDTNLFRPRAESILPVELSGWADKKIILFVGNLLPVKRLDVLLQAIRACPDEELVLAVAGGGYAENSYRKIALAIGLESRVRFLGPVSDRNKLGVFYNQAGCLVVSSDAESYSLAAAEALASGCPVIASDLPSLRVLVEPGITGFLFTPGVAESLRKQLDIFFHLAPIEQRALGERGRARILEKYSLNEHISRLEKIYQEIIQ